MHLDLGYLHSLQTGVSARRSCIYRGVFTNKSLLRSFCLGIVINDLITVLASLRSVWDAQCHRFHSLQ